MLKKFCEVLRTTHEVIAERMNEAFLKLIVWPSLHLRNGKIGKTSADDSNSNAV